MLKFLIFVIKVDRSCESLYLSVAISLDFQLLAVSQRHSQKQTKRNQTAQSTGQPLTLRTNYSLD